MKENFRYLAKLSLTGVYSFLKIVLIGAISTILVLTTEFILLTKNIDAGRSGHVSAIPFLMMTFSANPVGCILWHLTCLGSPILIFIIGNKYVITKLANKLIGDKAEGFIYPILDKLLLKFKNNQPELIKNIGDLSLAKLKIIQGIKDDNTENKWVRKIITFGMEKIEIDDLDFKQENFTYYDIIKAKTIDGLKTVSEPSQNPFWILIGVQWAILLFIWSR